MPQSSNSATGSSNSASSKLSEGGAQAPQSRRQVWRGRKATLEALTLLISARLLVRFVPLGRWRNTLGSIKDDADGQNAPPTPIETEERLRHLRNAYWAGRKVERAAHFLPGTSKCLPQAMALQWMLRRRDIGARLIIASLKERSDADEHAYHAWVETGGEMIIGACERADYAIIMTLTSPDVLG